jgi:hypothetical protein
VAVHKAFPVASGGHPSATNRKPKRGAVIRPRLRFLMGSHTLECGIQPRLEKATAENNLGETRRCRRGPTDSDAQATGKEGKRS